MSVHYKKGPDHHWMTLLAATKPNWSRPPAANGPERNSPGWVMTVFSAFLFTPFWCPHTPHLTPAATSPVPSPYPCSQPRVPHWPSPLVSSTLTHTSTQCCWSQCLSVCSTWQQMLQTDQAEGIRTICLDETWSSSVSHTAELGGKVSARWKFGLLIHRVCEVNGCIFNPRGTFKILRLRSTTARHEQKKQLSHSFQ